MKRLAILAFLIIFFGCITQPIDGKKPTEIIQNGTGQLDKVNTSGLSFNRTANNVLTNETIPEIPTFDFSNTTNNYGKLIVYYFYMPKCPACLAIKPEIDRLEAEYAEETVFLRYDITSVNGSYAYKDFTTQYGLNKSEMYVPQVLVNKIIITDMFNINKSLENTIIDWVEK